MPWRQALHRFLIHRYPDARDLRDLIKRCFGPRFVAELPPEGATSHLAQYIIDVFERRASLTHLFTALQDDSGGHGDALVLIIARYITESEDPTLAQVLRDYAAHTHRVARRPPLETLVGSLLGITDFDLERVFIPLTARPLPSDLPSRPPAAQPNDAPSIPPLVAASVLDLWPARTPWLLLIGEPGAGKSVLTRWFSAAGARGSTYVPIRIELRRYANWAAGRPKGAALDFLSYLTDAHRDDGVPLTGQQLGWLILAGKVAWLIDGLDEVSDPEVRFHCATRIANLRFNGGYALITSRPRGVDREIHVLREAGLAIHELCPLDDLQIHQLGERWYAAGLLDANALIRARNRVTSLRELMRSPLITTLILVLARHGEIPRPRQQVLAKISTLIVRRWVELRHPGTLLLDSASRTAFLRHLAWYMLTELDRGRDNIVTHEQLLKFTRRFLFHRDSTLARDEVDIRAERAVHEFCVEVNALVELGGGCYGFVHRSFLEFFAADALAESNFDECRPARFATHWHDPHWSEILSMACGLLATRDEELSLSALRRVFADLPPLDSKKLFSASEFTVRCLAEIDPLPVAFTDWCITLTELWLALIKLDAPDMRRLAPALRSIGPRWPGAARLYEWFFSTRGVVIESPGIDDHGLQMVFRSWSPASLVSLVIAVAPLEMRSVLVRTLRGGRLSLYGLSPELMSMGPLTELEKSCLAETFNCGEDPWGRLVFQSLGDFERLQLVPDLIRVLTSGSYSALDAAIMLISYETHRCFALDFLDKTLTLIDNESRGELHAPSCLALTEAFRQLDEFTSLRVCTDLLSATSFELRAFAALFLTEIEDGDEGVKTFINMLRSPDLPVRNTANWVLVHCTCHKAIDRVLNCLDGSVDGFTLEHAISNCAQVAEKHGRWEFAHALWCQLADDEKWQTPMRWLAVSTLLRRPFWRESGLERISRTPVELGRRRTQAFSHLPYPADMATALRALADHPDGSERLRTLLKAETIPLRREVIAQVLLEHIPNDPIARTELLSQADASESLHEQHALAHLMRSVGLSRSDWETLARKIATQVPNSIARCSAAILLGDCDLLCEVSTAAQSGETIFAAALLRCEAIRQQLGALTAPPGYVQST